MLGCITRWMPHHFDHCFFSPYIYKIHTYILYIYIYILLSRSIVISCMSENKRSRKNRMYRPSFPFPKHYKPISIAAPLSNLPGESQQSCCVRLNPLLCFLITRHACVRTRYFPHASPPFLGSSSPSDLENVCSPKRLPPSEENSHKRGGADVVKEKKKILLCMIIRAPNSR